MNNREMVIRQINEDWNDQEDIKGLLYANIASGVSMSLDRYEIWLELFVATASRGRFSGSHEHRKATIQIADSLWGFVRAIPTNVTPEAMITPLKYEIDLLATKDLSQPVRRIIIDNIINKKRR